MAALAAAKQRVLLVDADPVRRAASRLVLFAPAGGLIDARPDGVAVESLVKRDERSGISIVALSGRQRREAASLEDVKAAFAATKAFDLVIVTASGRDAAARTLVQVVDKVALVVDAGGLHNDEAEILTLLDGSEGKLAGVVVANAGARAQPTAA